MDLSHFLLCGVRESSAPLRTILGINFHAWLVLLVHIEVVTFRPGSALNSPQEKDNIFRILTRCLP